ncbi:MAG: hypothetical protein ACXU7H_07215, partial [Burkholderiaceae bacterium]
HALIGINSRVKVIIRLYVSEQYSKGNSLNRIRKIIEGFQFVQKNSLFAGISRGSTSLFHLNLIRHEKYFDESSSVNFLFNGIYFDYYS